MTARSGSGSASTARRKWSRSSAAATMLAGSGSRPSATSTPSSDATATRFTRVPARARGPHQCGEPARKGFRLLEVRELAERDTQRLLRRIRGAVPVAGAPTAMPNAKSWNRTTSSDHAVWSPRCAASRPPAGSGLAASCPSQLQGAGHAGNGYRPPRDHLMMVDPVDDPRRARCLRDLGGERNEPVAVVLDARRTRRDPRACVAEQVGRQCRTVGTDPRQRPFPASMRAVEPLPSFRFANRPARWSAAATQ